MRPERGGSVRRLASLIALGCLLGAATVGGTTFVLAVPASASCISAHENVQAKDAGGFQYGNRGNIYVNSSTVINSLQDSLYRSLMVFDNGSNFVEVGWGAGPHNITGNSGPTVFAFWINDGVSGKKIWSSLTTDTDRTFTVENVSQVRIFRFYFDGESSPFAFSPTMDFNYGLLAPNSEHYNTCDSLWAHMNGLNYFDASGNWSVSYGNLECWYNSSTGWYLYKNSDSELHVYSSSSGTLC